ncbi:hypothetical protein WJX84_003906 [Apatococcus fuscideae]|uniref:RNA polymerase II subunit B1 CTD phosphatase RPAP2 homolog n=1 Tax=Apatococcus fuscideae TaxID=2026836 RepID=A0AAW1SYV3_9CHLO
MAPRRWDDYGVVDDDDLQGHAPQAGPSLHPRDVHSSDAALDPFAQPSSVEAGAGSATALHHHLQTGKGPSSQQGPVVERQVHGEAGTSSGEPSSHYSAPGSGHSAERVPITEEQCAMPEQSIAMASPLRLVGDHSQDMGNVRQGSQNGGAAAAAADNDNSSPGRHRSSESDAAGRERLGSDAQHGQPQIVLDIDFGDGASVDGLADAVGRLKVSSGEDDVEDVEGAEWNEDADFEDRVGSEGSETDSLDQFANEELGREGTDSDVEADVAGPDVQSDYSPWLGDPPIGARALSGFGQLFNQLDAAVTHRTQSRLQPSLHAPSSPDSPLDSMPARPWNRGQVQQALHLAVSRALPRVMRSLHIRIPRPALERSLYPALETLHFPDGLPSFTEAQWQILVLLLLKGLSLEKLPVLRPTFESRDGVAAMQDTLSGLESHLEEFHALLDVLLVAD